MTTAPPLRVAVIGSGITGLAAATYLRSHLPSDTLELTMYEADSHIGGHAHTQSVDGIPVDTGFMVFNGVTYPNMIAWFNEHGVEVEESDMSLAVSMNNGGMEWSSCGLAGIFAQKRNIVNPYFAFMIRDVIRFESDVITFLKDIERPN